MPLSNPSKSKASLASLSATTAAAAESLWSRSKKSSKKKPPSDITYSKSKEISPPPPLSETVPIPTADPEVQLHQQAADRHEFRRRFLEGLQFYCENSSLILNSDLPADLIEFVTCHGFSVEALGIILELKKSSTAFSSVVDKKTVSSSSVLLGDNHQHSVSSERLTRDQNFSEISRRLLQHWMSADSCAEAFVSLSLGEEIPGLIAECASFQRILFAVPDSFHIVNKEFLNCLLSQITLAVNTLSHGIRISSEVKVRTQLLASVLDRILTRYFSDGEYFYTVTDDGKSSFANIQDNPFLKFVAEIAFLSGKDVIARRLVPKIFLQLSSHSTFKLAKIVFCLNDKSLSASTLLYPATEFLENNSQWKLILQTLPVKTTTRSKRFWSNWAAFVETESKSCEKFWRNCVDYWIILNKSPTVDEHSLFSSSLAVAALARQIKQNRVGRCEDSQKTTEFISKLEPTNVLQNVVHSLESINENKKACGMALAEVVADLQFSLPSFKDAANSADAPKPLKFDCSSEKYLEILEFYKNGIGLEDPSATSCDSQSSSSAVKGKNIQVLDSDDDELEEEHEYSQININDDGFNKDASTEAEVAVDERVMELRIRNKKIPMYFSEIVEVLLEGSKNEDEAQILKYIVVLKIPVLICSGVKIDTKMCITISRCLADMDEERSLQTPILTGLYELYTQHPFDVADLIGGLVFDRDHYTLGQRLLNLNRLLQIMQISSKQACFNCHSKTMAKHEKEYLGIYPEFLNKYFAARKKLRFCQQCQPSSQQQTKNTKEENIEATSSHRDEEFLTWQQIVDRRVAAKTRYLVTPKSKTVVTVPDEYSSKLVPMLWSTIANRLTANASFYLSNDIRAQSGNMHDIFLVNVFQYLGKCIFGTSGSTCPHFRNLASHAGELVINFVQHEDANVRRSVLSLLGIVLHVGEGKLFVIEALSSKENMMRMIDILLNKETDHENLKLLKSIQTFLAGCTAAEMLQDIVKLEY